MRKRKRLKLEPLHLSPELARAGSTVYSDSGKYTGKLLKVWDRWAWVLWERDGRPTTCELNQVYRGTDVKHA